MTPEERQEFNRLQERVRMLEEMRNLNTLKLIREAVFGQPQTANDGAVDTTLEITIGAGGGTDTEQILDFPDGFIEGIKPNGERVMIPTYAKSRFT